MIELVYVDEFYLSTNVVNANTIEGYKWRIDTLTNGQEGLLMVRRDYRVKAG